MKAVELAGEGWVAFVLYREEGREKATLMVDDGGCASVDVVVWVGVYVGPRGKKDAVREIEKVKREDRGCSRGREKRRKESERKRGEGFTWQLKKIRELGDQKASGPHPAPPLRPKKQITKYLVQS